MSHTDSSSTGPTCHCRKGHWFDRAQVYMEQVAALRADMGRMRGQMERNADELARTIGERDALRAERDVWKHEAEIRGKQVGRVVNERDAMRPVVKAARSWRHAGDTRNARGTRAHGPEVDAWHKAVDDLSLAVDAYRGAGHA